MRYSRLHPPAGLEPEAWQVALRRQYGREQVFGLENIGDQPVFSEFRVKNPASGGSYRVAIRGTGLGENYCSCPDFATNDLGTCKHVEFTLAQPRRHARRSGGAPNGISPPVQRNLSALRRAAQRAFPSGRSVSAEAPCRRASPVRRRRRLAACAGAVSAARCLPRGAARRARAARVRRCAFLHRANERCGATARAAREGVPRRGEERGAAQAVEGAAASVPGGRRALRRPRRALPDRRRHGARQDRAGDRGGGNPCATRRRRARAGGLSRLAQAPVGDRADALCRPQGPRDRRRPDFTPQTVRSAGRVEDRRLRHDSARPAGHIALVAGHRHRRRGPAHQELEHHRRAGPEAHRKPVRVRADGHAAGEPAGGADLDSPVRRPASSRADVAPAPRAPAARRDRPGGRLSPARRARPNARAGDDPPAQERGPHPVARAHRQERVRSHDRAAARSARGKPRNRRAHRREVAQVPLPFGGRSAAHDLRASEHAHVVQQHVAARSRDRSRRQGRRARPLSWRICSRIPTPRPSCSASGPAPTS